MSLEADKAGGRAFGRRLPTALPSSSQLNSRSLSRLWGRAALRVLTR